MARSLATLVILAILIESTYSTSPYKITTYIISSEKPRWWTKFTWDNNLKQKLKLLETARNDLLHNVREIGAGKGRLLETFETGHDRCALACAASPDCHFIKLRELPSDIKPKNYTCSLYSEFGVTSEVTTNGKCISHFALSIWNWINITDSSVLLDVVRNEY